MLCVVLLAVGIILLNAGLSNPAPCSCANTTEPPPTVEPTTCVYHLKANYIQCGGAEGSAGVTCDTDVSRGRYNLTPGVYRYREYKIIF